MNRLIAIAAGVCACVTIACSGQNSSPTQPSAATSVNAAASLGTRTLTGRFTNLPVTTIISDTDASGQPADLASDDANGVGSASYSDSPTLTSHLLQDSFNSLPYGDWQFNTSTSTRAVRHDFLNAIVAPPFPVTGLVPAPGPYPTHLQVTCTFQHKSMIAMSAGTTINCGLSTNFVFSSTVNYAEEMAPEYTGQGETTDVQITCNAASANASPAGCIDWFIDPLPATGGVAVARLTQKVTLKKATSTEVGDFNVRLHFHITRP